MHSANKIEKKKYKLNFKRIIDLQLNNNQRHRFEFLILNYFYDTIDE